jgi:hypothetical protein
LFKRLRYLYLLPLFSLAGGNFSATNAAESAAAGPACKAAVYSLANRQVSFSTLAVETYLPFELTATGHYTLCTGKEGASIVLNSDPGYGDFYFPYNQALDCSVQLIESADNCYPTYSAKNFSLTFPDIKIPWAIVLPDGKQIPTEPFCYQASLAKNPASNRFNLSSAAPIACP